MAYLCSKWHLDPCSRLATRDMGRKLGAVPSWRKLVPDITQCVLGRGPTSEPSGIFIHPTVWPQYIHGPKSGAAAPPPFSGDGSPSNSMSPVPRPISVPSGILIQPAVWAQQMWAKNWGCAPLRRGSWVPISNTMWPGPRPDLHAKFRLDPSTGA